MTTLLNVLVGGLQTGAVYALVALGIALVYKATRVLNFAQGELGTVAAFLAFLVLAGSRDNEASGGTPKLLLATVLAVIVGALLGVAVYFLIIQRVSGGGTGPVTSLVATAGFALLCSQLEVIYFEAKVRRFPRFVDGGIRVPGTSVFLAWHTVVILAVLAVVALLLAIFFRTNYGTALLATAQDPFAAELQGVPVLGMRMIAWGVAGAFGAMGGVLGAGVFNSLQPGLMTTTFLIPAFAGVVLGGLTSLVGAVAGGLFIGITVQTANQLNQSFDLGIPGPPQAAVLAVLLVVLLVRPSGLFGSEA